MLGDTQVSQDRKNTPGRNEEVARTLRIQGEFLRAWEPRGARVQSYGDSLGFSKVHHNPDHKC